MNVNDCGPQRRHTAAYYSSIPAEKQPNVSPKVDRTRFIMLFFSSYMLLFSKLLVLDYTFKTSPCLYNHPALDYPHPAPQLHQSCRGPSARKAGLGSFQSCKSRGDVQDQCLEQSLFFSFFLNSSYWLSGAAQIHFQLTYCSSETPAARKTLQRVWFNQNKSTQLF